MLKLTLLFKNSILNYKKIDIKQAFNISFEIILEYWASWDLGAPSILYFDVLMNTVD